MEVLDGRWQVTEEAGWLPPPSRSPDDEERVPSTDCEQS